MMKTRERVLEDLKAGKKLQAFDGRDAVRLARFFPVADWPVFDVSLKEGHEAPTPKPWTEGEIRAQLASDLEFAFEKALDKRGISSACMYEVIRMWLWVLDDALQHNEEYAEYGLPLYKAVAVKYGLPNPIGDDSVSEFKYSMEAD